MPILLRGQFVSDHALSQLRRRGIDLEILEEVLTQPEQRIPVRAGREVRQRRIELEGRPYIIRVFVDVDRSPAEIVTVYRSSKITKYWSSQL